VKLPDPVIREHESFQVIREDLIPGGTKVRAIPVLFDGTKMYAYASPVYGYAQIALAHAAKAHGKDAVIFCARRNQKHARTLEAYRAGASVFQVDHGRMSVVRARAREFCLSRGGKLLPFGLDVPEFVDAIAAIARTVPVKPREVWCAAGSGVLTRALQKAWPDAEFHAVRVGSQPDAGRATVHTAPETFEEDARIKPPFPSCSNYDAKVWQFMKLHARKGALLWNL
jgi:hypothetical protein